MRPTALFLCNRTRHMGDPWLDAGYNVVTVDLQEADVEQPGRTHIVCDVRRYQPNFRPCFIAAFPPCTHVAVSGSKHFRAKGLDKLIEALETLNACRKICEAAGCPYMIENPVSVFASYWRDPDHYFHPANYTAFELDDHYTKKTCLWTGGGFVMPKPKPCLSLAETKPDDRIHKAPPSEDRGDIRSETPKGFARAVFMAQSIARAGDVQQERQGQ